MTERLHETLTKKIAAQGAVPEAQAAAIAAAKTRSLGLGLALIVVGIVVALGPIAGFMWLYEDPPGTAMLLFCAPFALVGLTIVIAGGSRMSGEALDVRAAMGGPLGLLARFVRLGVSSGGAK